MDPWYYFGEFIHFPHYEHLHPNYAGERLPWILPGYALVHLFSASSGVLLLHLSFYYMAIFSLYAIVKAFANVRTALLTSCLLGCHPLFLGANGWTYVDGACIAYLLLAFYFLTKSLSAPHRHIWILLSGTAWAALIYTYLTWLMFSPCCMYYYSYLAADQPISWKNSRANFIRFLVFFSAGFAALTVVLSVCFGSFFVHRFFFYTNIKAAFAFLHMSKPLVDNGYTWVKSASWILLPVLMFLASIGLLFQHGRRRVTLSRPALALLAVYLFCFTAAVVMTVRNNRLLQWDYFASILIPIIFLSLGVTILKVPAALSNFRYFIFLIVPCAICLSPLVSPERYQAEVLIFGLAWPYAIGITGLAARLAYPKSRRLWALCLCSLAFTSSAAIPEAPGRTWHAAYDGLAVTKRVEAAIHAIEQRVPADSVPVFWIDDYSDPMTMDYRSIMCGFVTHGRSMWHFPSVDEHRKYPRGTFLVLITRDQEVFERANKTMASAGMPLSFVGQDHIGEGEKSYWITYTRVL